MTWRVLRFGKHRGKTLAQVLFADPNWFFWARGSGVFQCGAHSDEADFLARRARRVLVPRDGAPGRVVYFLDASSGKLADVDVNADPGAEELCVRVSEFLSFEMAYIINAHDKVGSQILVREIKATVFGSASCRVTRERADQFFSDDRNFAPPDGTGFE